MKESLSQEQPTDEQMLRVVMRAAELLTYTVSDDDDSPQDDDPTEYDAPPPKPRKTKKSRS